MTERLLRDMLSYCRPHQSLTETDFIATHILPLGVVADSFGNYWLSISRSSGTRSRVLWSSHLDTVHLFGGRQKIYRRGDLLYAPKSECLGADDTTGVYIMHQMILAGVPGVYVFHRGEERGCIGSRCIAFSMQHILKTINYAIAFDRRGTDSIVTHQIGQRTASDAFAYSLQRMLPPKYTPDNTGIYTDTASYAGIIPECTNLSIGYKGEHGRREKQSISHVMGLIETLKSFDETHLLVDREPKPVELVITTEVNS